MTRSIEDYMQSKYQKEGVFRAFPLAWTVEESSAEDSKSVAIAFQFALFQEWHGKESGWSVEWPPGYYVENRTYVVKRDGSLNQGAVDALGACGLWDGDWDKLAGPVPNVFVLVDVKAEVNPKTGKTDYRAAWVNPNADEPQTRGQFKPADTGLLASLRSRFQGQTRAQIGGGKSGQPPAPPQQPTPAGVQSQQPPQQPPPQQPAQPPNAPQPSGPPAASPARAPQQPPGPPTGAQPPRTPATGAPVPPSPQPAIAPPQPQGWDPAAAAEGMTGMPTGPDDVPF